MSHHHLERTLVIIKPDGLERNLVGEIVTRFERTGLKIKALKMMRATADLVENHYTLDPSWKDSVGQKTLTSYAEKGLTPPSHDPIELADAVLKRLVTYMVSGPVIAMVLEGFHAVKIVRKIVGGTEPLSSAMGTIRGDYVVDSYQLAVDEDRSVRNLVHASGSVKEAEDEIAHWFTKEEII